MPITSRISATLKYFTWSRLTTRKQEVGAEMCPCAEIWRRWGKPNRAGGLLCISFPSCCLSYIVKEARNVCNASFPCCYSLLKVCSLSLSLSCSLLCPVAPFIECYNSFDPSWLFGSLVTVPALRYAARNTPTTNGFHQWTIWTQWFHQFLVLHQRLIEEFRGRGAFKQAAAAERQPIYFTWEMWALVNGGIIDPRVYDGPFSPTSGLHVQLFTTKLQACVYVCSYFYCCHTKPYDNAFLRTALSISTWHKLLP